MNDSIRDLARENKSAVRSALARVTQTKAAEAMGISDTTLGDWLEKHQERLAHVLAAVGLKVVPVSEKTYDPKRIASLIDLAGAGIEAMRPNSGWGDL